MVETDHFRETIGDSGFGFREPEMVKWKCTVCPYVYDPDVGDPGSQIPPGTPFEELPDDWLCPDCVVGKEFFEPLD